MKIIQRMSRIFQRLLLRYFSHFSVAMCSWASDRSNSIKNNRTYQEVHAKMQNSSPDLKGGFIVEKIKIIKKQHERLGRWCICLLFFFGPVSHFSKSKQNFSHSLIRQQEFRETDFIVVVSQRARSAVLFICPLGSTLLVSISRQDQPDQRVWAVSN